MGSITISVPIGEKNVQCVECGTVLPSLGLVAPCNVNVYGLRECGGTEFTAIHQCHWNIKLSGPLKFRYQRVLKFRGWDPHTAEHEYLRVIRNELHKDNPCLGYIKEKMDAMYRHVEKGIVE